MHKAYLGALATLSQAVGSWAATVTYDWNVTWVSGAPDGFNRPIIGINNEWPCPLIEANVGDTIVINMTNKLVNETTGLHFHGINQINSNFMDGAAGSNQCPVPPEYSISYSFLADSAGTYWYHSHNMGQYPDGLRGPLIVHDPADPYLNDYDEDIILTVSDWYHSQTPALVQQMLQPNNTEFLPPHPNSITVNEGANGLIPVEAGKTYRIRIINFSALTAAFISFESLSMDVVMIDASYVRRQTVDQLRISASQRYDILVTPSGSDDIYPYLLALDTNRDYTSEQESAAFHDNFTGALTISSDDSTSDAVTAIPTFSVSAFQPFNDVQFQPYDNQPAYGPVTKHWVLNFDYCQDANGYPRACFNGSTFIDQTVPTLYSVASLGGNNTEVEAYGSVGAFTVAYGEVLEIVINNNDTGVHPFHLHGHQFQVLERPFSNAGDWDGSDWAGNPVPPRRDTVDVYAHSHVVLRIVANNPGVFLLHCHIEWHVEMGLAATLIEAPERLIDYPIPQDHIDVCEALGVPTSGNAAGNAVWWDTDGFITVPPTTFTGSLFLEPGTSS
ncbi:Cupredoxin [Biscogniauxia marginata]|nr:Cupredoxin [Biscogniauxia marginata]